MLLTLWGGNREKVIFDPGWSIPSYILELLLQWYRSLVWSSQHYIIWYCCLRTMINISSKKNFKRLFFLRRVIFFWGNTIWLKKKKSSGIPCNFNYLWLFLFIWYLCYCGFWNSCYMLMMKSSLIGFEHLLDVCWGGGLLHSSGDDLSQLEITLV